MKRLVVFLVMCVSCSDPSVQYVEGLCVPGEAVACVGPGGCEGGQVCEGGDHYSVCVCSEVEDNDAEREVKDAGAPLDTYDAEEPEDADLEYDAEEPEDADLDTYDAEEPEDADFDTYDAEADVEDLTCPDGCYDGDLCTEDICDRGTCVFLPRTGNTCNDGGAGTCYDGVCCTGCWDGMGCQSGGYVDECGWAGDTCQNCDDGNECTADTCISTGCYHEDRHELSCAGGVCRHSNCEACGQDGEYCCEGDVCDSGHICGGTRCETCGGDGESCCEGGTCATGDLVCNAGTCEPCGARDERCCIGSTRCEPQLDCVFESGVGSFCRCGDSGQSCCDSSLYGVVCNNGSWNCVGGTCR